MDSLTAARAQMEVSLGFHMVFAALGIGMPLLMVIAEQRFLATGLTHFRDLAQKWSKATALLFVVGAVSGTALSFELGLLWPGFMGFAGPALGPAFTLEGYAFLIEAIFLGLYLYGWEKLTPKQHWLTGIPVAVSGALSGILVVGANAWMQSPRGFVAENGRLIDVDPLAVFTNPSWAPLALHSTLACYVSVGFAVAGIYAYGMLRGRSEPYHRAGLRIAMIVGVVSALVQPLSGDILAKLLHRTQPEKLAAMEAHFETQAGASLLVGGIPDVEARTVHYGLHIPRALSVLATGDPNGVVRGLDDFPEDERPNVLVCHIAFQIMVGAGFGLMGLGLLWTWGTYKKRAFVHGENMLRALVLASPLGFIALEAGWVVTEVGRQPWIVYRVMRTADAVTPRDDVGASLITFTALYAFLAYALVLMLMRLANKPIEGHE